MSKTTIEQLESGACLYWPKELAKKAAEVSVIGPLIETQDLFLSVLKTASKSPSSWELVALQSAKLSPNLFLKHLMVLSDISGERVQQFSKDFQILFPSGSFRYAWQGQEFVYNFSRPAVNKDGKIKARAWNNTSLNVEKSVLLSNLENFTNEMRDVCMLLLWGSSIIDNPSLPPELSQKCVIGTLLGQPEELDVFVKQRYIEVSRIIGGSLANDLGHIFEQYIVNQLNTLLPKTILLGGHTIEGITHNDNNLTTFDLVAKNQITSKFVGIEISFQVTTNSVIERKASAAKSRKDLMQRKGYGIAYVVDGSGNFQRRNALQTIMNFSDCTVNFSDRGLKELAEFIENKTS